MGSEFVASEPRTGTAGSSPGMIMARLDRISVWALPATFLVIIGVGFLFTWGWRLMYAAGALLALLGILLRFQLPESPRWLLTRNRTAEADRVVTAMEERAARIQPLAPVTQEVALPSRERHASYGEIFTNPLYLQRTLFLLVVWLIAYVTVYTIAAGFTSVLTSLAYPPPEAGLIAAIGTLGFIACGFVAYAVGKRLER